MFGSVSLDVLRPAEEAEVSGPGVNDAHVLRVSRRQLRVEMVRVKTLVPVDREIPARAVKGQRENKETNWEKRVRLG